MKTFCKYRRWAGVAGLLVTLPVGAATVDAPNVTLAKTYRAGTDLRAYCASEKLDGVRAYWDGEKLRSRRGNVFVAPAWFSAGFPNLPLDGELWSRRGDFETISGIVRRARPHEGWRQIKYMVFDLPAADGGFRTRSRRLQNMVAAAGLPHLQVVPQWEIGDAESLHAKMREITAAGGEGIMLRRKDSPYRGGRGDDLLKLKPFADAEATVLAHHPGKGKLKGLLGSLEVESGNGIRFKVGSGFTLAQRRSPPSVGARITYKYSGFTSTGIPRFPVFLRVRNDEPAEKTAATRSDAIQAY